MPVWTQPLEHVRLLVMSTVLPAPLNWVRVLLYWSCAVTWIEKALPAVCGPIAPPPSASALKWSSAAALTVTDGEPALSEPSEPPEVDFSCTVHVAGPAMVSAVAPGPPPDVSP